MKYELTGKHNPRGLRRIRALRDIPTRGVKVGDLGGWVQSESNLSQEGDAWVFDNAQVSDNAQVYGDAWVFDDAQVSDNAKVYDKAKVAGNARVYGHAQVYGDAWVFDNAQVYGDADVASTRDYLTIGPIGRDDATLTAFRCADGIVKVTRGCFLGSLDELDSASAVAHVGEHAHHRAMYVAAIALIRARFGA